MGTTGTDGDLVRFWCGCGYEDYVTRQAYASRSPGKAGGMWAFSWYAKARTVGQGRCPRCGMPGVGNALKDRGEERDAGEWALVVWDEEDGGQAVRQDVGPPRPGE